MMLCHLCIRLNNILNFTREKMLGYVSLVIICHSILSSLRWRMFLQGNSEQVSTLPIDVLLY